MHREPKGLLADRGEQMASELTVISQVSSVSKLTIVSPPLASSVLFGGRNRATTVAISFLKYEDCGQYELPFIELSAPLPPALL